MVSKLLKLLPKVQGQYREGFNLAKNTWFNVGGKAEILYKPSDVHDLSFFIKNKPRSVDISILGACSNVIIRDNIVEGVVIKLGREFANINVDGNEVEVGCASLDYNVASFLLERELSGLEFLIGIPGMMGGAVAMNSGCYGQEIADCLVSVEAVNIHDGTIVTLEKERLGLGYRTNAVSKDYIFTKATFILQSQKKGVIQERMDQISKKREDAQPIRTKTGGSTFKNPKDSKYSAWELVDQAGLRGYRLGDSQISEKHCNFMLNLGNATAQELECLGEIVREKVYRKTGIMLQWEIKLIGRY